MAIPDDARLGDLVRRGRLEVLTTLAPYQAITVAFATILAVIVLSVDVGTALLTGWVAVVVATSWLSLTLLEKMRHADGTAMLGKLGLWYVIVENAVRAAVWVALPAYAFSELPPLHKIVLIGLIVCVAAGSIALVTVPAAALGWVAILGGAMIWLLYSDPAHYPPLLAGLPVAFSAVLLFGLFRLNRFNIDQINLSAQLGDQNRNVTLLLEEYEHRGIGWLWETDAQNRLLYISPQIGMLLGRASSSLREYSFPSIFGGSLILSTHLQRMSQFEKVELQIAGRDGPHWISISGSPKYSRTGQFDGFRGTGLDITEAKLSNDRLVNLANIDSLTGLPNRANIRALFEEGLEKARGSFGQCGILFLDLDGFKPVNDTYGHSKGDALLKAVAGRLTNAVAGYGQVGRFGGDEFAVVMPNADGRKAMETFATHLIKVISETYLIDHTQITIGCSIGGAMGPSDAATVEELLKHSDLALYHAKTSGRGIYRHFDLDLQKKVDHRIDMEKALREALKEEQFELHYQPIVSAQSQQILGFEALIRWEHPTKGRVSPVEFIPIAEEVGLIGQIGEWALRTACRQASSWPAHITISVNVSPVQLLSSAFPHIVGDALAKSRLSPNRLELEVTESIFLTDADGSLEVLKRLQSQGVRIALDDFGTGYSSLGYLNKAIFNKLKIDRSFVREAGIKKEAVLIVQAIVALANSFRMTITAEGVETADELKLMRDLGCHQIQGYIFSKPMPYPKTLEIFAAKKEPHNRMAG